LSVWNHTFFRVVPHEGAGSGYWLELGLMLEREFEQSVGAVQAEFPADVGAVVFHRSVRKEEFGCNVLAASVIGDGAQNGPLRGSEIVERRVALSQRFGTAAPIEEIGRERCANVMLSVRNGPQTVGDLRQRALLEDVAPSAQIDRSVKQVFQMTRGSNNGSSGTNKRSKRTLAVQP